MTYRYHVTAECRATVTEQWTLTSPTPLRRDEIEDILSGADETDGPLRHVTLDCTDESVSDEEDRVVVSVDSEDQED